MVAELQHGNACRLAYGRLCVLSVSLKFIF